MKKHIHFITLTFNYIDGFTTSTEKKTVNNANKQKEKITCRKKKRRASGPWYSRAFCSVSRWTVHQSQPERV